jgi:hypothetical protein
MQRLVCAGFIGLTTFTDSHVFPARVVGLFQKPADMEDASTPENKSVDDIVCENDSAFG